MLRIIRKSIAAILSLSLFIIMPCACKNSDDKIKDHSKVLSQSKETSLDVKVMLNDECLAHGVSPKEVSLVNDIPLTEGMKISVKVEKSKYIFFKVGTTLSEALLYIPDGLFEYTVPDKEMQKVYPDVWNSTMDILVRIPTDEELRKERIISCNPFDVQSQSQYYPHASSNSECRNDRAFLARNAIDGFWNNTGHGDYPYQSWGPEQIDDPELYIDFGREVLVTKVIIYVRADGLHDAYWNHGKIAYSNGQATEIDLEATAKEQIYDVGQKRTTSISLVDLVGEKGWKAISEIKVIGKEIFE